MVSWQRLLESSTHSNGGGPVEQVLLCLLLTVVLGQAIAWTYAGTHSGLSYSRSFTQSLVLLTVIVGLVMLVIGNNIVTAFGLIGALAIIRFRNVLKDTRDTAFVFLALVIGMAVGSEKYLTAILGTAGIAAVAFYLHYTSFGSLGRFDGQLSLVIARGAGDQGIAHLLRRFCRSSRELVARPSVEEGLTELVFAVRLRDRRRGDDLLSDLRRLPIVRQAALVLKDELYEL